MARRRLTVRDYELLLQHMRDGMGNRELDRKGLASRNKSKSVRALVEPLGWLNPAQEMPTLEQIRAIFGAEPPVPVRESAVEPFRAEALKWIDKGLAPTAVWRKLKLKGFKGSVGSVKRFVRHIEKSNPKAHVVLHYEPGQAAQVDFGAGPKLAHPVTGKITQTHVFVVTLCDSRHMYAELVWDQTSPTWLRCHRNAFEFFGGVPREVIIDNLKSAITRAISKGSRDPEAQRSYEDFARAWGFKIVPCEARRPNHKGRVERGVGYTKKGFLAVYEFSSLEDGNAVLLDWVLGEAGNRTHGTTQEVPLQAFAERESLALQPLPEPRPEQVTWAKAKLHPDCHISFEKSFYSAPYRLVGTILQVRAGERVIELYRDDHLVAVHARAERPGTFRTNTEHYPPEKAAHLEKTAAWCNAQAAAVGPYCVAFVTELLGDRVVDRLRAAQGVFGLAKRYGRPRLEAACARALSYENIRHKTVKDILEKGLDQVPDLPDRTGQLYLPFIQARFQRNIGQLVAV